MPGLLRDVLLSFCPASVRQTLRPESSSRAVHAAGWTGLLQLLLFAWLLVVRYKAFLFERARLLGPALQRAPETVQSGVVILTTLELFLYPLSILLLYFALEGLARCVAGAITSEIVPSLPVYAVFKLVALKRKREKAKRLATLPQDVVERFPGNCLRIATARPHPTWNANVTLVIQGEWYEVAREETGEPPRMYVYLLSPAPPGKVLRRYEEYEVSAAVSGVSEEAKS